MALTCTNVTLRQRVISNGRISLYLDYYPAIRNPYTMKMSRREYLGIYIYARPKNEIERDFNHASNSSLFTLDIYPIFTDENFPSSIHL